MTLARHGSAQMSMETYAKPKPERLRSAVEAVAEGVQRAIAEKPCSVFVPQAVGAEGAASVSPEPADDYALKRLATPTGFEPVLRG